MAGVATSVLHNVGNVLNSVNVSATLLLEEHGFTTRKDGHGFGLHSGALAATEMGGTLTAQSEGTGYGATFTLEFPASSPPKSSS
jgi:signal transduction histidine kinase